MAKHLKVSQDKKSIIEEEITEQKIYKEDLLRQKQSLEVALENINQQLEEYESLEKDIIQE